MTKEYWLGKRVISMTNGFETDPTDQCISIGTVTGFFRQLPIVKMESSGEEFTCFSTILGYSDDLYNILLKLTASERYSLVMAIVNRCNIRE